MSTNIKVGDEVIATLRGTVDCVNSDGSVDITYTDSDGDEQFAEYVPLDSVEVVKPPVTTFKPGDIVRYQGVSEAVFALAIDGFVDVANGAFRRYGYPYRKAESFTSDEFEKVEL